MKNKNKIINELYEKSPDVRERIRKDVDFSQFEKKNAPAAKSSNGFKWATAVLSVALIAMIAVLAPIIAKTPKPKSYASDYVVFIDVNPSVRLDVSGGDVVTAQKGMNKDGVVLLYQENLVGKNIDEAATYILEKMKEAGLVKDKGNVGISITDKKTGKPLADKQRHAVSVVKNLFGSDNISALILSDDDIKKIEDNYNKNNVGEYEKQMIDDFKKELLVAINEKINRINDLCEKLNNEGLSESERKIKDLENGTDVEKEIFNAIKLYGVDYKLNWNEVKKDKIKEFYEDIDEKREKLEDCIEDIEISDGDDSYGEILSDLLEIVKEELFEKED